jgi:hypothetical protein
LHAATALIAVMPPKKKEEVKAKPLLGRFSNNLKVGGPLLRRHTARHER